ncbi:Choline-sulfatase [Sphingobacterium sp. JB170]|nr:Choline-sulfatase [Sphingobacterium sp. JB170]
MLRKLSLVMIIIGVCALQSLFGQIDKNSQPNVVLIIADDIGWGDIGFYGNTDVKTPNIDALAASSLVFNNMYLTTSSCSPSRCSLISGRYPHNTGAPELHDPLPADQVMFPEILRNKGYYTALSGKNHMGNAVKKAFELISLGKGPGAEEDWLSILQNRPKEKPFFMWFASHDAHRDWQFDQHGTMYNPDGIKVPPMMFDGPQTRKDVTGYYHEISRLDHYVGEVVGELKRQGIYEDTYIIFMSDNGSPFPRNKARLYDSGIKSPFIVHGPQIGIARDSSLVSAIDIAPTILEIAGLPAIDNRIQGKSFLGTMQGREHATRDFVFAEHNWHVFQAYERMVRFGDWVYIRNGFPNRQNLAGESTKMFPAGEELWTSYEQGATNANQEDVFLKPRPAEELFNVSSDPFQFTNLVNDQNNQKILSYLRSVLTTWIKETGDSRPENPTPDRDDIEGKRLPLKWSKGEKPGAQFNAHQINQPGPILKKQYDQQNQK